MSHIEPLIQIFREASGLAGDSVVDNIRKGLDALAKNGHLILDEPDALPEPTGKTSMLYIGARKEPFRCTCGANVFSQTVGDRYFICNGCTTAYDSQPDI